GGDLRPATTADPEGRSQAVPEQGLNRVAAAESRSLVTAVADVVDRAGRGGRGRDSARQQPVRRRVGHRSPGTVGAVGPPADGAVGPAEAGEAAEASAAAGGPASTGGRSRNRSSSR